MPRNTEFKELHGSILGESAKAIKFEVDMPGNLLHNCITWFPLSQIDSITRSHDATEGLDVIWVSAWIFQKKAEDYANVSED
jgi:hypothetical protein